MTTVCSLIGAEYHCWCEDQYFWPCEKCTIYGPCDDVNNSTCGCINGLPDDEQLCQPINELSYNSTCPPNPVRAEYLIEVEISTADFSFGYQLKYDLETSIFPFINFMKINMTTVCQLIGIEYQCTCQDQYFWSLDNCAMYGTCNYANENACTCINALPSDGQMCVPTSELPIFYYLVEFKINTENTSVINEGRNFLGGVNLPFFFGQVAEITDVEMTTVCSLIGAEYHCWCEDQYFWPCEKCTIYGPCDDVNNSTCGCINGLPDDEQLCQPINELSYNSTCPPNPVRAEYLIEVEISTADFSFGYQLKYDLETSIFPFINFMKINMTTVCQLIGIEYQCTCQDQYFWSLDNCAMYGTCNYANENACTCINALPSDGQMCVPTSELPIFYYLVEFKINTENTSVINEGRNFLGGVNLPFFFGQVAEITDVEMTTVCSLIGAEYHCWCEDQYFWPCEKCTIYGPCDDVNNSTCGCINGLPDDEQLCQPINELSYNSTCPPNPVRAEYLIEVEISTADFSFGYQLKYDLETSIFPFINFMKINMTTVCQLIGIEYQCTCQDQYFWSLDNCAMYGTCNYANENACTCINALPSDGQMCVPTSELPIFYYLVEFKINTENTSVINEGRNFLGGVNLPFFFGQVAEITDVEMTTVCSLIGAEYHCWCEDQYFWPCEKCTIYGPCDDVNNSTCGCINGLPDDEQLCQPINELSYNSTCPPNPIRAEYLIEVEISASDLTVLFQLLNIFETPWFPFINISEINITTVCSLNGGEYQCRCESQYFWPCEMCTLFGSCGNITNFSCDCINTLPNDGHFCQPMNELIGDSSCPPNPLKAKYLIEFEMNAVDETVLNQLRALLEILSVPFIISNIDFTEIDITTVCRLNGTQYQCRCEDQYFWPCEKCTLYGSCGEITNTSCDCITAHPNGGQFCQPNNELTNNFACIIQPITTTVSTTTAATKTSLTPTPTSTSAITATTAISSKQTPTPTSPASTTTTAVPPRTTTSIATASTQTSTTTTTATSTTTQNSTSTAITNAVNTTNAVTKTNTTPTTTPTATSATTTIFTKPTTTPIANSTITTTLFKPTTTPTPTATSTTTTTLTKPTSTTTPTPITTTAGTQLLTFTLSIIEDFDFELSDQTSAKYKTYKAKIETSINLSYRTVSGYVANSTTVTNFRPGSVLADFTIQTTSVNLNLVSANENLASSLRLQGFNVSDSAFSQSVKDGLYKSSGNIYPGTNLILTCNPPVNNGLTWTLNGGPLPQSDNILQLNNAAPSNSGQYACTTKVNSMPYVIWQVITIHPYPNIQVTSNKLVQCQDTTVPLQCCVQSIYQVEWGSAACSSPSKNPVTGCISCDYPIIQTNCMNNEEAQVTCQLQSPLPGSTTQSYNSKSITLNIINKTFDCFDNVFGAGNVGVESTGNCSGGMVGYQVAQCISPNIWNPIENYCVLPIFKNLQDTAKTLQAANIPQFMANLSTNALLAIQNITASSATILTIVDILNIISNLSQTILINPPVMNNFLQTTDVIGSDGAQSTWVLLNSNNTTKNASSELLKATERIATRLSDGSFFITTNISSLNKTFITAPFSGTFGLNSTTQINIPVASAQTSLTVIISSAFNNILPVRNLTNNDSSQTGTIINGDVAVIETNSTIKNISLSFNIKNMTLGNPQCVFWNYSLLNGIGGWDSTGCQLMPLENETEIVTCECNHTTSFSILMSPFTLDNDSAKILNFITYIGVAISLGCLVLCLLIEIIIWKSVTRNDTSYMRHVSIVNIALSLLIADICFIIGAAVVNQGEGPCSTATFFMHFFYLALFFWMLLSALLLLYRTLMVFSRMTRGAMMAIAFTVGYGAPLIIAVVTVASTAGQHGYIQKQYNCWLNWSQTKALLAFVIPVLTIVAINFLVLIVVLFKMLRRGANASIQQDEKHPLVVIARCVAILTPLFGLTWGFGIGTLVSPNRGIHIVFAFFNSLQGFFILVFGTLLDSKVREALAGTFSLKNFSSYRTRSTSGGPSSSSGFPFFQRMRQRNAYNISSGGLMSSSSSATDT
ncbi:uncharacterized protein Hap1MRO34_019332 isoform 2-T2 [Clarias gariepinus]